MLKYVRDVKVVIFFEKVSNPLKGMVDLVNLLETLSDVMFNGKRAIWQRSLLRSPPKRVRSREVRLVSLLNSPRRKGSVGSYIVSENRRRLVMERNCLETRERDFMSLSSPAWFKNLKTDIQQSSGKCKSVVLVDNGVREFLFLLFNYIVLRCNL
jgi:hypothetical protein